MKLELIFITLVYMSGHNQPMVELPSCCLIADEPVSSLYIHLPIY